VRNRFNGGDFEPVPKRSVRPDARREPARIARRVRLSYTASSVLTWPPLASIRRIPLAHPRESNEVEEVEGTRFQADTVNICDDLVVS